MNKKRETLLRGLVFDWLWMYENDLGEELVVDHGYMGSVVVFRVLGNNYCDPQSFEKDYLPYLRGVLKPYQFSVWQTGEYLNVLDDTDS